MLTTTARLTAPSSPTGLPVSPPRSYLRWIIQLKGKSSTGYESVHFSILSVIVHFCHWNGTSHSLGRSSKLLCPRKRTGRTDVDHSFGRVRFRGKNRRS